MTTVGDGAFRRDDLYGRANDMSYSGALSFLRRKYTRDLTGVDVTVAGLPFDCATSDRPGTRYGPRGIRAAVVGDLSTAQPLEILRALGGLNIVGTDIVEVAPVYDQSEITALAAATIGHDYLCLLAQKKGATARAIGTTLDEKISQTASTEEKQVAKN